MFSKSSLLAVVSALALALPSVQGFAITGCYAAGLVTELVADITTIENTNIDSNEACAALSVVLSRNYGYYSFNTQTCYSTDVQPLLSGTTNSVGTIIGGVGENVCQDGDLQGLDVNTPYENFGCAIIGDYTVSNPVTQLANPLAISSCLRQCEDDGFRYSLILNVLGLSTCRCSQAVTIQSPSACGLLQTFIYVDTSIAPTGVARRRLADQQKRSERVGLCPSGTQACRVNNNLAASDDFECIDVQAELESCGGCTAGILDGDLKYATSGVDCTAIEGVEMGAVSCVTGQCQVSQCRRGYALVDNTCVSTRSVAAMALGALRLQNL